MQRCRASSAVWISMMASVLVANASCGGSSASAKDGDSAATAAPQSSSTSAAPSASGEADAAEPAVVPDKCEQKGQVCSPPPKWVKKLCGGFNPDVALVFFRKGSPFTRAYLKGDVDAVNASGGATSSDKLKFDEEVIVLIERRQDAGGMQVSGASGSFDVLRWDGSCATLSSEEMTFTPPPKAKNAKITFRDLGDTSQEALLKDDKIAKVNADRRKECKGVSMGEVSAKCVKLVDQLSDLVADYVRQGGSVPPPEKLH